MTLDEVRTCDYCFTPVTQDGDAWVDETNGDVCSGNIVTGDNENEMHSA